MPSNKPLYLNLLTIAVLIARESRKGTNLVKALEEAMKTDSAFQVMGNRLKLNQHLEVKYTGCIVSD